jgi:hypothetical protein
LKTYHLANLVITELIFAPKTTFQICCFEICVGSFCNQNFAARCQHLLTQPFQIMPANKNAESQKARSNVAGLPDFSLDMIPKQEKMYQMNKKCQMFIKYPQSP